MAGRDMKSLAAEAGCGVTTVHRYLLASGVKTRGRSKSAL